MSTIQAIILAIVEGLTEFLPVSSTGHMIIAQGIMQMKSTEFIRAFTVIIQFGAILSVLFLYWKRFLQSWSFYGKLLVAFLPAAVFGLLLSDYIDQLLENVWVVATMLVLGGIFMLFIDKWFDNDEKNEPEITYGRALKIGFAQVVAMIPGVSRSMATIVGGMAQKLSRKTAAEFSFFLAVPTMAAASAKKVYDLVKVPEGGHFDFDFSLLKENLNLLIIGNVVAFIVAILAIKFFINFLTKHGFKAFGYYRILAGAVILILLFLGIHLEVA